MCVARQSRDGGSRGRGSPGLRYGATSLIRWYRAREGCGRDFGSGFCFCGGRVEGGGALERADFGGFAGFLTNCSTWNNRFC